MTSESNRLISSDERPLVDMSAIEPSGRARVAAALDSPNIARRGFGDRAAERRQIVRSKELIGRA